MKVCFALLLTLLLHTVAVGKTYDILAYGAKPDDKTINTQAIQKAIDACTPGDTVYIQAGHYTTGTVHLKSNITLYIGKDAFLTGSANINDYEVYGNRTAMHYGILAGNNITNVKITGPGTIQSSSTLSLANAPLYTIHFQTCKDVTIQNLSVLNVPCNAIKFDDCVNARVLNLKVTGSPATSGAGVGLHNCTNGFVNGCQVTSKMYAISVHGQSQNIEIANCSLSGDDAAIRIASHDSSTVKNVRVNHVNITRSGRGVYLSTNKSGSLEEMSFANLFIETKQQKGGMLPYGEPVYISAFRNADSAKTGTIKNIRFDNIICDAENQIRISGQAESPLQDVSFENLVLNMRNGTLNTADTVTTLTAIGASYVSGLSMNNIAVTWPANQPKASISNGIWVSHFTNFKLSQYSVATAPFSTNAHAVKLTDGNHAVVDAGDVFKLRVTEPQPAKPAPKVKGKKLAPGKVIASL